MTTSASPGGGDPPPRDCVLRADLLPSVGHYGVLVLGLDGGEVISAAQSYEPLPEGDEP